jgi:hypothetical protein
MKALLKGHSFWSLEEIKEAMTVELMEAARRPAEVLSAAVQPLSYVWQWKGIALRAVCSETHHDDRYIHMTRSFKTS